MDMTPIRRGAAVALLTAALGPCAFAQAKDDKSEKELRPRLELGGGAYFVHSDSTVQVSSNVLGIGTTIHLEDDLGLSDQNTAGWVDGLVRFGSQRRQRLEAGYFSISQDARHVIDERIQFGDRVFPIEADVRASVDFDVLRLDYSYMLYSADTAQVGAAVGVFGVYQRAKLSETSLGIAERKEWTFPLPTLGLRADFDIGPRLALKGRGDVFFFDSGDYNGQLYDVFVGLELDIVRHVGAGLGFNYANLDAKAFRNSGNIEADFDYTGPVLYLKATL